MFSLEIYCRTAKLQVDGLARSYGPQRLRIYRMRPELGPPELEEFATPTRTARGARVGELRGRDRRRRRAPPLRGPARRPLRMGAGRGGLRRGPYAAMRDAVGSEPAG